MPAPARHRDTVAVIGQGAIQVVSKLGDVWRLLARQCYVSAPEVVYVNFCPSGEVGLEIQRVLPASGRKTGFALSNTAAPAK